ncbi:MAG: hypothetical protein KMY53_10235 [Desulfarculus sp.]|nr:hypothetical protein [Pseudomonadota bacterium]MBV1714801.1 hypothetical protein [Desulfarculus sp.]MBU4576515.1 hypothetical protein [Pseudomonadota bacterium]MBU4600342.1 hypothetical protein [Pseudomonadota bacterium]MBV1738530.1 hypothetical protein [Desulfarculus sp.]
MPLAAADFYRGAALSQIIGHPAFETIKPLGKGRYLVNGGILVWLRHSKEKSPWNFAFNSQELTALGEDLKADGKVFLCLVCRRDNICALDGAEIAQALKLDQATEQTLTVTRVPGRKSGVSGPGGEVEGVILASAFPDKVFS